MNVEQKIRNLWASSSFLTQQIPLKRLTTGTAVSTGTLPYGVIREKAYSTDFLTNAGPKKTLFTAEVELYAPSRRTMEEIRENLPTVFDVQNSCCIEELSVKFVEPDHWKMIFEIRNWE